jgi:cell shape-determining protein MreD
MGGGLRGVHALTLVLIFFLARRAARRVYLAGTLSPLVVVFVASMLSFIIGLIVRWALQVPFSGAGIIGLASAQSLLNATLAYPMLRLFWAVDNLLSREHRERRAGLLSPANPRL